MESSKVEKINPLSGLASVHGRMAAAQSTQDTVICDSDAHNSMSEPLQSVSAVLHRPTNSESMMAKLAREIAHLENWLAAHEASGRSRSTSLSNTIRSLIKTRRTLMENIEHRLSR